MDPIDAKPAPKVNPAMVIDADTCEVWSAQWPRIVGIEIDEAFAKCKDDAPEIDRSKGRLAFASECREHAGERFTAADDACWRAAGHIADLKACAFAPGSFFAVETAELAKLRPIIVGVCP